MDNSTKKLLEECSVGCKMGIESKIGRAHV